MEPARLTLLVAGAILLGGVIGRLVPGEYGSRAGPFESERRYDPPRRAVPEIPTAEEWDERGIVLRPGAPGEWDARLHGMINPGSVIEKEGTFFLYYIGADGDRSTDGGPRHRAVGVATSRDGIHFEKYPGNPILRFHPKDNQEEGIYSVAAALADDGIVLLYFGAMEAKSPTSESVDGDVMLATGTDGISFEVVGDVLHHADPNVWGYGDELFPIGVARLEETWWLYYTAKGHHDVLWDLGVAKGSDPRHLAQTRPALQMEPYVYGGDAPIALKDGRLAFFLVVVEDHDYENALIEVRLAPIDQPDRVGPAVSRYAFPALRRAVVHLARDTNRWFMYYYDGHTDTVRVKTAPRTIPSHAASRVGSDK